MIEDRTRTEDRRRPRGSLTFGFGGPSGGGNSPDPTPIFADLLQSTLVPEFAGGVGTPTITRATTAAQTDFEGKLNQVLSGEARFQGARRVRNQAPKSEDLTASWSTSNATATLDTGDFPTGTTKSTAVAASAQFGGVQSAFITAGRSYRTRFWAKGAVGGETVWASDSVGTGGTSQAVTTAWVNYASTVWVAANGTAKVGVSSVGGGTVKFSGIQYEDVTGQANQNPSEYVSVGVLSAPYYGAGVDGVAYPWIGFPANVSPKIPCLNGNTVASNVVTEATGAAINSAAGACAGGVTAGVVDAFGPYGYLAEGARTNQLLQSQTLGTTWTVSNAADMNAVTADQYVAPDGTTTMDLLQPKATTAVHSLNQAITFAASVQTVRANFRYVPATPQRWVALVLNDGTTTWAASFDLLNGVVGALAANTTSTITATGQANVYRVTMTTTAVAAAAGSVKISLNATDSASLESAARAGTETLGAWGLQCEAAAFASSYIPTTTVAVTRNADVLTYAQAGNWIATIGSVYAEASANGAAGVDQGVISSDTSAGGRLLYFQNGAPTTVKSFDGANTAVAGAGTSVIGNLVKIAVSYGGSQFRAAQSGQVGSVATFAGYGTTGGNIRVGDRSGSATELYGTIRNVKIYNRALSAAQLQAMTT